MNTEFSIPIYISLHERQGSATDMLVLRVKELAIECDVNDSVRLYHIDPRENNPTQNRLLYVVETKPAKQRHSAALGEFLDKLFSQFFYNTPTFAEPVDVIKSTDTNLAKEEQ